MGYSKAAADQEADFRASMTALRAAQDVSQTALAGTLRRAGYAFHQQTIAKIESGERPVRLEEAYAIAEALGSSVQEMALGPKRAESGWALKSAQDSVLETYKEIKKSTTQLMNDLAWLHTTIKHVRESGEFAQKELIWDAYAVEYDPISAVQEGIGEYAADAAMADVLDKYRIDKHTVEHIYKLYREVLDAEVRPEPSGLADADGAEARRQEEGT
ncbi:helix-turn-helix transcriptional regulator [Promicromonospora sp. NPDC052451]|uniref:helix-turn-helix transcriptional regulator n=1 Tax=Promicromonospora sp. NPDC052451 TaxID=3364407 RepID=UPI0037CC4A22